MEGFIIYFILYMIPGGIARLVNHKKRNSIVVINLFLGWTVIGWVICLAWAVSGNTEPRKKWTDNVF